MTELGSNKKGFLHRNIIFKVFKWGKPTFWGRRNDLMNGESHHQTPASIADFAKDARVKIFIFWFHIEGIVHDLFLFSEAYNKNIFGNLLLAIHLKRIKMYKKMISFGGHVILNIFFHFLTKYKHKAHSTGLIEHHTRAC